MSEALGYALDQMRAAEKHASEQLRRDYPLGSLINWDDKHRGKVMDHGHGLRIKVKNTVSNRAYWIHAYRISD